MFGEFPDVDIDYAYADAITVHLLKRPDFYDVIVAENMFGDIISDLGAATVGGMGISPSGEIGDSHGLFQGAHGSAPDIAGQDVASPVATILSGARMLRWLADKHGDASLDEAAGRIETAVEEVLAPAVEVERLQPGQGLYVPPPQVGARLLREALVGAVVGAHLGGREARQPLELDEVVVEPVQCLLGCGVYGLRIHGQFPMATAVTVTAPSTRPPVMAQATLRWVRA